MGALLLLLAEKILPDVALALVRKWLGSTAAAPPAPPVNPVDSALGEVRRSTDAARTLDTSDKAIANDPNNRARPR